VTTRLGVGNPVLLSLVLAAGVAVAAGGFVGRAPNRLVSGEPIALWAAAGPVFTAAIAAFGAMLLAACFTPPGLPLHGTVAVLSGALLLLALAALGHAALSLSLGAPPAVRVSPGAAFWILAACALLSVVDAVQHSGAGFATGIPVAAAIAAGAAALAMTGSFDALSIAHEYQIRRAAFGEALGRHIVLVAGSVGPAVLIGFPLGIAAARHPPLRGPLFAVLNTLQTVPSIALFGLLILPLSALAKAAPALAALGIGGIGMAPALIALVLYALLPVVRNTATGLAGVDPAVVDAARGMGMNRRQVFWQVELSLASPVLLGGLRIVTVQAIGLAVVAALIGAGGLGSFVFDGLGQYAVDLVLLGALPAIFLALVADFALQFAAALLRRHYAR
jgi:osmoprotectant transport system permease protein